jgi:hypothetical protein
MPRINTVPKSRKPVICSHCHIPLPPGSTYRWIKLRYGSKQIRCTKPECQFKPTDLSTSKTARIEEAIDEARTDIYVASSHDELQTALQSVADVAREVADEYQEASDNWAGGNGHEEFQEKADTCNSFADELEGWSWSGEDEDQVRVRAGEETERLEGEDIGKWSNRQEEAGNEAWEQVLQEMREEAEGVLDSFSL